MRFIRENIYERIQREVRESMHSDKGRITKVELTPTEWRKLCEVVSVKGDRLRMAFSATQIPSICTPAEVACAHQLDVHYVDVVLKREMVGF